MNSPLIGMPFLPFLALLVLSAFAAAVVHWGFHYRLFDGWDGYLGQWMVAWIGAWLGPAVLGHWFDFALLWHIYVIPALLGGFAGAFAGTLNAKVIAGMAAQRTVSS